MRHKHLTMHMHAAQLEIIIRHLTYAYQKQQDFAEAVYVPLDVLACSDRSPNGASIRICHRMHSDVACIV